ncbi:hypothetical protein EI94DRAFT_1212179 [Lactarius quietus]|nr:hypothetical protein EI94DRAFT_1212179 [Lactarius quietus]
MLSENLFAPFRSRCEGLFPLINATDLTTLLVDSIQAGTLETCQRGPAPFRGMHEGRNRMGDYEKSVRRLLPRDLQRSRRLWSCGSMSRLWTPVGAVTIPDWAVLVIATIIPLQVTPPYTWPPANTSHQRIHFTFLRLSPQVFDPANLTVRRSSSPSASLYLLQPFSSELFTVRKHFCQSGYPIALTMSVLVTPQFKHTFRARQTQVSARLSFLTKCWSR